MQQRGYFHQVEYFYEVECTPLHPYVHQSPRFSLLQETHHLRGLIYFIFLLSGIVIIIVFSIFFFQLFTHVLIKVCLGYFFPNVSSAGFV